MGLYQEIVDPGHQFYISAIENTNHGFTGWTGDISTNDPLHLTLYINMDKDRTITAHFSKIYKPANYSAQRVFNRSLSQGEYINVLRWEANPQNSPVNIAYYRIYRIEGEARELIQRLDSDVFEYLHRNVNSSGTYTYEIVASTSSHSEGEPARVIIHE